MSPPELRHNRNTYLTKQCSCDVCREAVRLYSEQRRRSQGIPPRQYGPYTVSEIVELHAPISSVECAERIGRTPAAIRNARAVNGIRMGPTPRRKPKEEEPPQ